MQTVQASEIGAAVGRLEAALDCVVRLSGEGALVAGGPEGLLLFAQRFERVRNRLALVDHRVVLDGQTLGVPERVCQPSMARVLVSALRLSPGEAVRRVRAAEAVGVRRSLLGEVVEPVRPVLAAAQRGGGVSAEQVAVIERALSRVDQRGFDPAEVAAGEVVLTEFATGFGPKELRGLAERVVDRIDPDGRVPDEQVQQDRRRVELRQTRDGGWVGEFRLTGEAGAKLRAVLDPLTRPQPAAPDTVAGASVSDADPLATAGRESGDLGAWRVPMHLADRRTPAQRMHDALEQVCDRVLQLGPEPGQVGAPATVIITIAADRLRDRTGCGVTGDGALLTAEQVRRVADQAEVYTARQDGRGVVLDLYRTRRLASRGQTIALYARDGGCSFPGCDIPPQWCERHHIRDWADGGETNLDNLTLLCSYHHHHFAGRGWSCQLNQDRLPEWRPPRWLDPQQRPLLNGRIRQHLALRRAGLAQAS